MTDDGRSLLERETQPLVELIGVTMLFRGPGSDHTIEVLRDVSLAVHAHQLVCVAGRSGSGKTTLLTIAAGLRRPSAGEVRWRGQPLHSASALELAAMRRGFIGYVFQGGGLLPGLTAAENAALSLVGRPREETDRRVRALFQELAIAERLDQFPAQLSAGEQQRVAIARALGPDPPVLIIDEPTAHLDRATGDDVIELLWLLRDRDRAVLVASHDPNLLARADAVFSLEHLAGSAPARDRRPASRSRPRDGEASI